ncbi:hypothetical protein [Methanomethylophilus alvi]|uniref:hypothetical protein n=1 Tax=Methanomethylophilus alvi TaxID=1291540 RepID=UPI0037DC213E
MAVNKRHESSIGKPIETTLLRIEFLDEVALDKAYDFFVVENKGEEDHTPTISDPGEKISDGRICGTCAEYKKRYLMLRKSPDNYDILKRYIDEKGDDFLIQPIFAADLKVKKLKVLLNILKNASAHELKDWLKYNNLDGELYMTYSKWRTKDHVKTVKVTIEEQTLGFVLKLNATMFSRIGSYSSDEDKEKAYGNPMYVLPKDDNHMHRTFKHSPNNYVVGNSGLNNAEVMYSDPTKSDNLKLSKNYIFDRIIENINTAFDGYIRISKESLKIEDYLDPDDIDVKTFMGKLASKIESAEYTIVNAIPDFEDAQKLQGIVTDILANKFGKDVQTSDEPVEGRFNLRIIHDAAYYKKYKLPDDYRKFPGMIVQHLTVEKCITENDEDAIDSIMNVLIKELFIKECVSLGEDLIGHWKDRGFEDDMMFLKRVQVSKKPRRYVVYRLTIHPDGKFDFDKLDDNDPFLFEMREVWRDNKSTSDTEHMIVYKGSVCTIENSGIVPVIDNEVLMESVVKLEQKRKELKESQDPENPKKKKARVPDGEGPRGYQTYNSALYAITDIQRLSFGDNLLYMCGYDGTSMAKKYEKAPNIRLVRCIRGENFFGELLDLMNVPFVRHGQTTVYPYPYKFMTEYIEENRGL